MATPRTRMKAPASPAPGSGASGKAGSAVNGAVTDSVTQVDTSTVGLGPANATGNLFQSTSQALSLAAHNAVAGQQQSDVAMQASTTMGVINLFAVGTSTTGKATSGVMGATG